MNSQSIGGSLSSDVHSSHAFVCTHSLCLKFFDFFDQTSLISEAPFYLVNESNHIIGVNSLVDKILNTKWVQVDLHKIERNAFATTTATNENHCKYNFSLVFTRSVDGRGCDGCECRYRDLRGKMFQQHSSAHAKNIRARNAGYSWPQSSSLLFLCSEAKRF